MERLNRLTRGQATPYASLPRIDWSHPLAEGLAFYAYQSGTYAVDLVNGLQGHKSTTAPLLGTYPKGTGWQYGAASAWTWWDSTNTYQTFSGAAPFSFAIATYYTAVPAQSRALAGLVANDATGNNASPAFFIDSVNANLVNIPWNNGNSVSSFSQTVATNTFQSWAGVATGATTANLYANGKLDSTATPTATAGSLSSLGSTGGICLNNGSASVGTSINVNGIVGFLPYFAGWNRVLTAAEALQLHLDPYAHLIYPEDELFIVGITAGLMNQQILVMM